MQISRRGFLGAALAAGSGASLLTVGSGCGSDDDSGSGGSSAKSCSSDITSNHGHTLSVSAADISAGQDKTYNIKGGSPHDHQVTVTAAHFSTLSGGGSVSVTSSTDAGHSHPVTITCG